MKKILFPTEFSAHAGHLFRYALEFARLCEGELLLLSAYGRPEGYSRGDDDLKRTRVLDKLRALALENKPADFPESRISYHAELDYPADAILRVAEEKEVELIVIGMTALGQDESIVLGSTADQVIRSASCPVFAMPASATFQPVQKILFTTDFEFEDILVLNFLIRSFAESRIEVLHVVEKARQQLRADRYMGALEEAFSGKGALLFKVVEADDHQMEIRRQIESGNPNLLAMTTHQRGFIGRLLSGSNVHNIARHSKTPLLIFKQIA